MAHCRRRRPSLSPDLEARLRALDAADELVYRAFALALELRKALA
jgi:hypothetical protein